MRISALARHPVAIVGAVVATASAVVFITLLIAMLAGLLTNPYAGLVVFIAIPAVFVMGLVLIPAGMWLERRKLLRQPTAVAEWPVVDFRRAEVRRAALLIVALTAVNIVIVLLAGYGGLHAMDSPGFCGQTCHTPMHPQFQAWQGAVHAGVAVRRMSHRRGSGGVRARQACRRPAAGAGRGHFLSPPDSVRRRTCRPALKRRCAGAATGPDASSAITSASSANMPTTKRTPRASPCCRCT